MPFIPRRVVTGHDEHGVSVFASDGPVPAARTAPDGALFYEIWGTSASPAPRITNMRSSRFMAWRASARASLIAPPFARG